MNSTLFPFCFQDFSCGYLRRCPVYTIDRLVKDRHSHTEFVYFAGNKSFSISDVGSHDSWVQMIVCSISKFLKYLILILESTVQHDKVVYLFNDVVAMGGYQDLHPGIHKTRQKTGELNLIGSVEMALRFVNNEKVTIPTIHEIAQEEIQIRHLPR